MKVEKWAENGQMVQNSQPLSPGRTPRSRFWGDASALNLQTSVSSDSRRAEGGSPPVANELRAHVEGGSPVANEPRARVESCLKWLILEVL